MTTLKSCAIIILSKGDKEMTKEEIRDEIIKYDIDMEDLGEMLNNINSWNGYFDELRWEPNDEEFYSIYFSNDPQELARAIYYGEYNYCDDYIRFNAYGNLETADEWKVQDEIGGMSEEIIEKYLELCEEQPKYFDYNNLNDTDLIEMIDKYFEEEEDEEEGEEE